MKPHYNTDSLKNVEDAEMASEFIQTLKGLMLDGVIHEFRNIFSIVTGYTEMLIDGTNEETSNLGTESNEELSEIIKGCNRGKELLDKVTLMTRRSEVYPVLISSDALIKETVAFSKFFIPKNVQYEAEVESVSGKVLIDVIKFQQLILSIILNILNAFGTRGLTRRLVFKAWKTESAEHSKILSLEICMLSTVDLSERYYPAKHKQRATTVGLNFANYVSIAKDLALHVDIVERVDAFGVRLEIPINNTPIKQDKPEYSGPIRGNGQLILVVDDEESVAEVTARRLQKLGYKTLVRTDPKEAVELIKNKEEPIDLLLTDQVMPEMTGLQLVDVIKHFRNDLKVIMVTGYASGITSEICRKYGIASIAMKPLTEGELAQLVAEQF